MPFIDFAALKERVTMERAISLLNIKVTKREGQQWRAPCPACRTGGDRVLSMNVKENVFRCFADGKAAGDQIALVAHIRGTSQHEAAEYLNERFSSASDSPRHAGDRRDVTENGTPSDEAFEGFCLEVEARFNELEKRVTALEENKIIKLRRT
jgi:hypothetical protein